MNCHFCGGKTIWNADFSFDDYGYDGEGIIAVLTCTECEAEWNGFLPLESEE